MQDVFNGKPRGHRIARVAKELDTEPPAPWASHLFSPGLLSPLPHQGTVPEGRAGTPTCQACHRAWPCSCSSCTCRRPARTASASCLFSASCLCSRRCKASR